MNTQKVTSASGYDAAKPSTQLWFGSATLSIGLASLMLIGEPPFAGVVAVACGTCLTMGLYNTIAGAIRMAKA